MRLARPFYRLPVRFDVARLQREVATLPAAAWVSHPNGIFGNSALRLITANGGANDDVDGIMAPTPQLENSPYLRQVLASFGAVWSRSRLMKLAPLASVPEHADINYHWYYRVRVHIPIFSQPGVMFHCGDEAVHMPEGDAWIFDNWRRHSVVNPGNEQRIHLVADTTGSSSFWKFVARAGADSEHRYDTALNGVMPLMERTHLAPVMSPAEVDLLVLDLRAELLATQDPLRVSQYAALLDGFRQDWRQLYTLHAQGPQGWPYFAALRQQLRSVSQGLGAGLQMRTNRIEAHKVLEGRLLRAILPAVPDPTVTESESSPSAARISTAAAHAAPAANFAATIRTAAAPRPTRPVFIIAAPRSGSTLLFETLASSHNLVSLGGEAHWLVEDIAALRPEAAEVDSNRLTASNMTEGAATHILSTLASRLVDATGAPVPLRADSRVLEKTPKNALRIPFFDRLFPDAVFIFLWRDPRENLSSIIEAWRSGRWKTYNGLTGFDGPWSLLLPPGWQAMNSRPLEEIAAFQWSQANRIALDDLERLQADRWTSVCYADLIAQPQVEVTRLARFIGIQVDPALAQRISGPLPLSRFTQTPPGPDKWRANQSVVETVLPAVEPLWRRLQQL
jgi:LPS sulfotransferase NodH